MEISLEQAVEIHARVLTHRLAGKAPSKARERALDLQRAGDDEGHEVWLKVADSAERLLDRIAADEATLLQ
ncbi:MULTISPECIES: hypothetical protein [Methylosinus]|uniref:Uncharacterized protein n=1 Tax=Methylosinus trichosporium (strain ATCC 35070 / NCIMB 11131 / UNIQEM 75 / OB3b) TaxID=595536 RepID=A0A2D2CV94_METT3|nr:MULTISPECIES: hypothetical protein [Methylosinus]ATQ66625.1 hypothetical protein CQW49_00975 [Methylosinus trichosporium OB3b]OBS51704.1 hypothetical protein A8B73_14860 [Methylosinus sp. 3S-1]